MGLMKKRKRQMPEPDLPSDSIMAQYDIMRKSRGRGKSEKGPNPEGYSDSQRRLSDEDDESRKEPKSLQEAMVHDHPNDEEDRSLELFDGRAERIDPLKKEYRENQSSIHMGRTDLEDDDKDADDIVSRIMRKMRRK